MSGGVNGQGQGRDIEDVNRFDVLQNIDREGIWPGSRSNGNRSRSRSW